jgi:hypothetical protein
MRLFILLFLISDLIYSPDIEWTDSVSKTYYNLSGLKRDTNNPWIVRREKGAMAGVNSFNFGVNTSTTCRGKSAAVVETFEVMGKLTPACNILGSLDYTEIKLINSADPYKGIVLQYGMGDTCIVGGIVDHHKTNFYLYCSVIEDTEVILRHNASL